MDFRTLEAHARKLHFFNLNDLRKIEPGFHRQQLTYWKKNGYIEPLGGGYYRIPAQEINEAYLFMLANRLYEPSYVSLESALAFAQAIPETVFGVTSVTTRKTRHVESSWGQLFYRSIKPVLMVGYQVVTSTEGYRYKIALPEKAALDFLYLNHEFTDPEDFEALRLDRNWILELDRPRLAEYLSIFNSQALHSRLVSLLEYAHA